MQRISVLSSVMACLVLVASSGLRAQNVEAPASPEQLAKVLQSDAPQKEKCDACRALQRVGTKDVIPVLAKLLTDEKLAHMARYAIEPMPEVLVDEVLRAAIPTVKGRLLTGVVGSLGFRHDKAAVEPIIKLLNDADPIVAQAAARALGSIGTPEAAKAIQAALPKTAADNRLAFCEGLLRCAEKLSKAGSAQDAAGIYDLLRGASPGAGELPPQVRTAGVRGAILARGETGLPVLVEALHHKDYIVFSAACRASQEMAGPEVTRSLVAALGEVPAENQVLLAETLAFRGDAAAVPALSTAAKGGAKAVRLAALRALAQIRNESAAAALKGMTEDSDGELATAAKEGLASFQAPHPAGT